MKVLHTYTCQAMSSRGALKGQTRTVAAGSASDMDLAADLAWSRTSVEEIRESEPQDSQALLAIERARAAVVSGRRGEGCAELERALRLLRPKDRDQGLRAEKEREAAGKQTEKDREAAVRKAMDAPIDDPAERLTLTQITQANKADLLKALRTAGAYEPGMEAEKNDDLRVKLKAIYGSADDGDAAQEPSKDE